VHTNTTQISARRQFSNCEDLSVHSTRAGSRLHGKSRCPNPSPPDPVHGRSSPRKCTPPCLFFSVCGPPTPTAVSRTSNEGTPEHDNDTEASKRCLSRPSVVRRSVGRRSVVGRLSVGRFVTKRQQLSPVTSHRRRMAYLADVKLQFSLLPTCLSHSTKSIFFLPEAHLF